MKHLPIFVSFVMLLVFAGCNKPMLQYSHTGELYRDRGADIVSGMQSIRTSPYDLWQRAGWWNNANILEASIDFHRLAGMDYSANCKVIYNANKTRLLGGFKNYANDDNAWWALAWIKAYDQYGDQRYLQTAQDIFADMVTNWTDKCDGGILWYKTKSYKNAVTNELFIVLAAKLAERQSLQVEKIYYWDWALRDWKWLLASGMLNSKHLFNDGLDENCINNKETTWTYNQGIILGGLKELYVLSGDRSYLDTAQSIALATISKLSDKNGILTEPCKDNCGEDGIQFKGIFIRYLSSLNLELRNPTIKAFIIKNASTAWDNAQDNNHLFDYHWQGPYHDWTGASSGSALDLMNAAAEQERQ